MEILKTIKEIKTKINSLRKEKLTIGFVPTMGALHKGHLSLIECSKKQTDITFVSIFVNPNQFNDKNDLKKYPRTIEKDINKLESVDTDFLFFPNEKEIYPEKDNRKFDFENLDKVMEGKYRANHFNGVAQVVSKLFEIIPANKAFFGLKDFQQYAIIKRLVEKYLPDSNIEIIACPIIRENDGLAMSSRNTLLSDEQRKNATLISQTLFEAKKIGKNKNVKNLKEFVVDTINDNKYLEVEYFEIVDDIYLNEIKSWNEKNKKIGCVAVHCGKIRLIDNIYLD